MESRDKNNYSVWTVSAIRKILFCGKLSSPDVKIYGSSFDKLMKYPSDIDVIETVRTQDINEIVHRFKEIISGVLEVNRKFPNSVLSVILGDIKCGIDHDFDIDLGQVIDMKVVGFKPDNIIKALKKLVVKKRLDIQKFRYIESLILNINSDFNNLSNKEQDKLKKISNKYDIVISNWLKISDLIYELKVLRWKVPDILAGKLNQNNKIHKLGDCVGYGMTKIDLIYQDNGKYQEVSNFFNFQIKGRDNNDFDVKKFIKDVQGAVLENFFSLPNNIMKGFKLIHTASKMFNDNEKYRNMLNSDLGLLYNCKANISTCMDIIKYAKLSNSSIDFDIFLLIVDQFSVQSDKIVDFDISLYSDILVDITNLFRSIIKDSNNKMKKDVDNDIIVDALELEKTIIENVLNEEAFKYAQKHKLLPIDPRYLPSNKPIILKN